MIKTSLSTVIGGAFWTPESTVIGGAKLSSETVIGGAKLSSETVIGGNTPTFDQQIQRLFSNGEQGFFYDPNDLTTLYQDAAGTIPVTAAGQPVGLMLDKSKGLVIGAEKWIDSKVTCTGGSERISPNVYRIYSPTGSHSGVAIGSTLTVGRLYKLTFNVDSITLLGDGISSEGTPITPFKTTGQKSVYFFAASPTAVLKRASTACDIQISNISIKELAGNHAYQATSASRPIFEQKPIPGANFVADSTLAEPSKWNTGAAPGISVSGNKLIFNNVKAYHASVTSPLSTKLTSGKRYLLSYTISEYVSGAVRAQLTGGASISTTSFNKNGRVSLVVTATTRHSLIGFQSVAAGTKLNISEVYLQEITGYLTGQNYLQFDGVDDFLQTNNIDFTATDKVSLFAGVQRLSDATNYQAIVDFGVNPTASNGSFSMIATGVSVGAGFTFESRGTVWASKKFNYSFAQGNAVICGKADILNKILHIQINSAQGQQGLINQGTGNYSNYPLYIGRRGGTSLPFNGHLYSLIGIGRLTTDSETIALEKSIAKNVGVTL